MVEWCANVATANVATANVASALRSPASAPVGNSGREVVDGGGFVSPSQSPFVVLEWSGIDSVGSVDIVDN